jgi:hypothetical protein
MLRRLGALGLAVLMAFGSAVVNTGCGTVLGHAGPQPIAIHINPEEKAHVFLDGVKVGDGSNTYEVDPSVDSHKFSATTDDGRTASGGVQREIMPLVVVCDAFMLLFPIFIDYFDGGMYSWKPSIVMNLGKAPEVQPQPTEMIGKGMNGNTGSRPPSANTSSDTSTQIEMKPCPYCGEPRPVNAETCPHCGLK